MNKLKVGIDFDGVLVDTVTQYLYWFNKITGENIKSNQLINYDTSKCIPEKFNYIAKQLWNEKCLYSNIQPIVDSQRYTKMFTYNNQIEMYVITVSSPEIMNEKCKVIKRLFPWIKSENIILMTGYNKSLIDVDILIDDNPNNFSTNQNKIIFNATWNHNFNEKAVGAVRAYDWDFIYTYISNLINKENNK